MHKRGQWTDGRDNNPPQEAQKYILTKIAQNFIIFSVQNSALEAYNDHSWVRSAPQSGVPVQDKFLAIYAHVGMIVYCDLDSAQMPALMRSCCI